MRMPTASIMGDIGLNRRCGGGLGQRPNQCRERLRGTDGSEAEPKKLRFDWNSLSA
jgi:hypothetical protein